MSNIKTTKTMIYKPDAVIEGWYSKGIAQMYVLLLPPHPNLGGRVSNALLRNMHQAFHDVGFTTLRINYRGIGLSQGSIDGRDYDLQDALDVCDWLSARHGDPRVLWVAGYGYGAYVAINAAMRRPVVNGFISVSPHTVEGEFDFNLLTPCPNGLLVTGEEDKVAEPSAIKKLVGELSTQRGCSISYKNIDHADHYYNGCTDQLKSEIISYLNKTIDSSQDRATMMA